MLEYHSHCAVLENLAKTLGPGLSSDPAIAAKLTSLLSAFGANKRAALAGAFVDEIVVQAAGDGAELRLLDTAAILWRRGLDLYDQLGASRAAIETTLNDPSNPDSVAAFNQAVAGLGSFQSGVQHLVAEIEALKAVVSTMSYLKPHPRQQDMPAKSWDFGNIFLARRTDAFVRAVFANASSASEKAFAFGALSGYAANTSGSAFVGAVVGGPRRAHRFRDRLARNAIGASLHKSLGTPLLAQMAKTLHHMGAANAQALPKDLRGLMETALKEAYPDRKLPDIDLGFSRVLRHLQVLDAFRRPDMPSPPPLPPAQVGDPEPQLTILDDNTALSGIAISLDSDPSPQTVGQPDSSSSHGDACVTLLIALAVVAGALLIYCIVQWSKASTGHKCDPKGFFDALASGSEAPDSDPIGVTQSQLQAMSTPDGKAHILQEFFNMQMLFWQAFDLALGFLAVAGLIYPDDLLIVSPLYQQFLRTPPSQPWPHRPDPDALQTYHELPSTPIEQEAANPGPFPANAVPEDFATGTATHSAYETASSLLRQILKSQTDTRNFDLDADRGYLFPCWDLKASGSIDDPILAVDILPYAAD
jgi:hypothetical protein